MRKLVLVATLTAALLSFAPAETQAQFPGFGYAPNGSEGLDAWRQKRSNNFWNRTSPSFGDPYYDPLKTSPMSPFRSPQLHPWRTSPFRSDPYYDPYAPRTSPLRGSPYYDPNAPRANRYNQFDRRR